MATDTHSYDSKLRPELALYRPMIAAHPPGRGRDRVFAVLRALLRPHAPASAYLELIIRTGHGAGNYDPHDDYYADDMLHLVGVGVLQRVIPLSMLVEQLEDLATGSCAQGRTHRLFQLAKLIAPPPPP